MSKVRGKIDKLLGKFGYYRATMPAGSALTEKEVLELFQAYGDNETFVRYLRDLCASDIRMYFKATNETERNIIRGAHLRTNYFISLIRKANDRK